MAQQSQHPPLTLERVYDAPVARVWRALTDNAEMKHWYFDLPEFRAEKGFQFEFMGGSEDRQYRHLCEVTEVIPEKKLSYTWRYDGYEGLSEVIIELTPEGDQTRLKLTHTGLESFPVGNPDFAAGSFEAGWSHIFGVSLRNYLEGGAASA